MSERSESDTCCRCGAEATFDSPRLYCDEHWARWWGGYDAESLALDGPSEVMYLEALTSLAARKEGRSG